MSIQQQRWTMNEVISLVQSANNILSDMACGVCHDRTDSVAWRLADALGILAEIRDLDDTPGLDVPTGLGFVIAKVGGEA